MRDRIAELVRLKKRGEEHGLHVVDKAFMDYARHWADYYNERIGAFRLEHDHAPTQALDIFLYDMVRKDE